MRSIIIFIILLLLTFIFLLLLTFIFYELYHRLEKYNEFRTVDSLVRKTISKNTPEYIVPKNFVPLEGKIDKNILQTYYKTPPSLIKENLEKRNPGWKYHFFNDEKCREFLEKEYSPFVKDKFDSFSNGAHKADLFRLCWIYRYGGAYVDVDADITQNFDNILDDYPDEDLIIPVTKYLYGRKRLLNCFFISKRGNEKLRECINNILKIDDEDLKVSYHLILHIMQNTLGDDFKYCLFEVIDGSVDVYMLHGGEWSIKNDKGEVVGHSRYAGGEWLV